MAIALRGTPQTDAVIDGGNVTLTFDIALQEGDLVIAFGGSVVTAGGQSIPQVNDVGYIELFRSGVYQYISWGVWYKVMGASPDADVTLTGSGAANSNTVCSCYAFSGVHADVFDQTKVTKGPITNEVPNCDAIVTQIDNAWVIAMAGQGVALTGDPSPGVVPGYENNVFAFIEEIYEITSAGATLVKTSAGSEDPGAWSTWATDSGCRYFACTVALKPAEVGGAKMVKVNGVWQPISSSMVKANGIWQPISSQMVHTPAGWKQV